MVSRKQSKRKLIGKYLKALAAMNPKEKKQKNTKLDAQHKFQIHKKIYLYGPFHLYYVKKNTPIESDPKKNKGNLLITEFTSFSKQLQIVKIVSKNNKACHAF